MLLFPAHAAAVDPQQTVGGSGSDWYSGSLLSQSGTNCSIIGNSYSEIMVSAVAGYGGAPGGSAPHVGDTYYTSFLVSIPGNPCGSGSSSVATTVKLPPNTTIDTSLPIRCFGKPRNSNDFGELTGGDWHFLGHTGKWCPSQASPSSSHSGAWFVGFRPLANGTMFQLFVPVKSTAPLVGAGGSPTHEFRWLTDATGVYSNPGQSNVWTHVFAAGAGGTPEIYFARSPTTIPFWRDGAAAGQRSSAEWFSNLYSAFEAGTYCWELHDGPTAAGALLASSCPPNSQPGWNGSVNTSADSWQVFGDGPNGGYAPFYYTPEGEANPLTIRWKFIYDGGVSSVSKDTTFTTLSGPDPDHDGVGEGQDACPNIKGTQANGCNPPVQPDPDQDGVYGGSDLCPSTAGEGALNGCPGGVVPGAGPASPSVPALTATLSLRNGAKLKRKSLLKGLALKVGCSRDSKAKATLSVSRKTAKKLGIATKKKSLGIAGASGSCRAAGGGNLRLKVLRAYVKRLRKARKAFAATLTVKLDAPGSAAASAKRAVKVG